MTSRERVLAAARGEAVDHAPFAVWRHFYPDESDARTLAETTVAFTRRYGLDLIKHNPRADYHGEPWGTRNDYAGEGPPRLLRRGVERAEDWAGVDRRRLAEPAFDEILLGLRLVREALPNVPLLATIFVPLGVLSRIAGSEQLMRDLRERPEAIQPALEAVTQTFRELAAACCEIADGIFLATLPLASRDVLTDEEYARFGTPYDLRVLEAVRGAPLNVLHSCGERSRVLELARAYPVAAVSWNAHGRENPPLDAFLAAVPGKAAIGGLSDAALRDPERATREARAARQATLGRRWICAGGCTIPVDSRPEAIDAARAALS